MPLPSISFLSAWKISAPQRSASRKDCAPTGTIIISCMSSRLLACAPPLITFIIGTGIPIALHPPDAGAAEVAGERQARFLCRRLRHRHGNGEQRVRAQPGLVLGAVQIDQRAVDESLLDRVEADHCF